MWRRIGRGVVYLWVGPGSLVGLTAALIARRQGGQSRVVDGVLEVTAGPLLATLSRYSAVGGGIRAITLGHVVLGTDAGALEETRSHERVHVRQYERWGPLFIPAYLTCSGWLWLCGRNPYLDNPFEVEAYRADGWPV
uniref:Signal peptide prediction n=1 Tax=Schlesneria paludicola TaxID=360056 RepID=A0A7C2K036_9PLAN